MADDAWREQIVGDRMRVDQEFAGRVREAGFSNQEWGLIMTAAEFDIEGEGEAARLVADTSKVPSILPELDAIAAQQPGPGGRPRSSGGVLDAIKSSLGLGGGVDAETRERAVSLVDEYAETLQAHLEEQGKWERVREASE